MPSLSWPTRQNTDPVPVCDPKVCYPSTLWLQHEVLSLIEIFKPPIDPIGYPIDFMRRFGGHE